MGKQKKTKFPHVCSSDNSLKQKRKSGKHCNRRKLHVTAKLKEQFRNLDKNLKSQNIYRSLYPVDEQRTTVEQQDNKTSVEQTKSKTSKDYLIEEYARTEELCRETITQLRNARLNDK